jgi:hypothetical protein
MLLDEILPHCDASERHSRWIAAPPDVVWEALRTVDLGRPWPVRVLMGLRAVPALLRHPRSAWRRLREPRAPATLRRVTGYDFALLAEAPGRELVLGIVGRFWTPTGGLVPTDAERFRRPLAPGLAQGAWSFALAAEDGGTRLSTETRVRCADDAARRSFARYWRVIRPFSGFLRLVMLREIARAAEARAAEAARRSA